MFVDVVDGAGWAATVSSQEKRKGSEEQKPNRALPPIRVTTFRLPPSLKKEFFFPGYSFYRFGEALESCSVKSR